MLPLHQENQRTLSNQITKNVFEPSDDALDERKEVMEQSYLRQVVSLQAREQLLVPRNNPHRRLIDFGIIPRSKYTIDVYLEILQQFAEKNSPEEIVKSLHEYQSLREAKISRAFVKKVIMLASVMLMPYMLQLVPDDGNWTLMIDGSFSKKDGPVLVVISAYPHQQPSNNTEYQSEIGEEPLPFIIPIAAVFLPSENTIDVKQILEDLKPKLPSLPKATMSDFREPLLNAMAEVFPSAIQLGCHYHLIEMIAKILVYPTLRPIRSKIRSSLKELNRWAEYTKYRNKSENMVIVARTMKRIATSDTGKYGENLLNLCEQMMALAKWAKEDNEILRTNPDYLDLMKILTKSVWRQLKPLLPRLEFVLEQFNHLRKLLTYQTSKIDISTGLSQEQLMIGSTVPLDQLINDWRKIGKISEDHKFNSRFGLAADKIKEYYALITPQILDTDLPRTNSPQENLFGRIKRLLRKWSGSKEMLPSFEWAAQLAAITESLRETDYFNLFLNMITSYEWIEYTNKLTIEMTVYRFQTYMANSIARKRPRGVVVMIRNLVISDILER